MSKRILSIIRNESEFQCLPCDRINLDIERFSEYRDSDEHPAQEPFESPPIHTSKKAVKEFNGEIPTILSYFLDGSRKTYKVADVIIDGKYLPLIAGQVGVCIIQRDYDSHKLSVLREFCFLKNVIAFPDKANQDDLLHLQKKITERTGINFILFSYATKSVDKDPVDLGVGKIMSEMQDMEIETVRQMAEKHLMSNDHLLVIDGPLRFKKKFDLVQFRNVIGLSKTFRPSFTIGKGRHREDVGAITSGLDFGERTSAYKMVEADKTIGMWYMRIRPKRFMSNPLQGIVKIENYAIEPYEQENGLDAERVDIISGHILRERNVTPYKSDSRWASHIYPVYMAETYLKNSFMSDVKFQGLF